MNDSTRRRPRLLEATIEAALDRFPVVVLTGARQTGKSTLATSPSIARGRQYLTLDDLDVLERAAADPELLVRSAPRLTIDEVQRVPTLLLAVKRAMNAERRPGQFLLTRSADLLSLHRVSESLAGRAVYLDLWPMTVSERLGGGGAGPWTALLQAAGADEALAIAADARAGGSPRAAPSGW